MAAQANIMILPLQPKRILKYEEWLYNIPMAEGTHEEMIGRLLLGTLYALVGYIEGKVKGIVVYERPKPDQIFIWGIYASGYLDVFLEKFKEISWNEGVTQWKWMTVLPDELFTKKVPGSKKQYTVWSLNLKEGKE